LKLSDVLFISLITCALKAIQLHLIKFPLPASCVFRAVCSWRQSLFLYTSWFTFHSTAVKNFVTQLSPLPRYTFTALYILKKWLNVILFIMNNITFFIFMSVLLC